VTTSVRRAHRADVTLRAVLLSLALVVFLLPLAWTALAAIGIVPNNSARPPHWTGAPTLDSFLQVGIAEPSFSQEVLTSTASAVLAALLATSTGFLAAYALARSGRGGAHPIAQAFLVLASLPAMAFVLPLGNLLSAVHLEDTFVGLVLAEAAVTAPLAVYVLYGAVRRLSVDLEEAARLDGASVGAMIGRVVVPLVAPSLAATGIVLFVIDWNLVLVPLIIAGVDVKTLPVAMVDFFTFERELEWPVAAAALIVSLVPVAVLVGIAHRPLDRFRL
jgi:ABC-type glycerol-3-phosphate transport system permease component